MCLCQWINDSYAASYIDKEIEVLVSFTEVNLTSESSKQTSNKPGE
jgi:hypothetical protein